MGLWGRRRCFCVCRTLKLAADGRASQEHLGPRAPARRPSAAPGPAERRTASLAIPVATRPRPCSYGCDAWISPQSAGWFWRSPPPRHPNGKLPNNSPTPPMTRFLRADFGPHTGSLPYDSHPGPQDGRQSLPARLLKRPSETPKPRIRRRAADGDSATGAPQRCCTFNCTLPARYRYLLRSRRLQNAKLLITLSQ